MELCLQANRFGKICDKKNVKEEVVLLNIPSVRFLRQNLFSLIYVDSKFTSRAEINTLSLQFAIYT